jgi:hypothetical protein
MPSPHGSGYQPPCAWSNGNTHQETAMWFWCLDHSQAEENAGCGSEKRLGPYPTAEAAATALKRINAQAADAARTAQQTSATQPAPRRASQGGARRGR